MIAATGVVLALAILGVVTALLLMRRLREKYAALWIVIGLGILIVGLFPVVLEGLTSALGVVLPANLLFALAILLLLGVALHLSVELSQAEDEIRRAAEELAILRSDHDLLVQRVEALRADDERLGGSSSNDD
jgi:hypothetical protein